MNSVFIQAVAVASGGMVSVGSILIVLMFLSSRNGLINGLSYVAGYAGSYYLIGFVVLFLNQGSLDIKIPPALPDILFSFLGCIFIILAFKKYMQPKNSGDAAPGWMTRIEKTSSFKALTTGFLIAIINFKNLTIYLSSVFILARSEADLFLNLLLLFVVVFIFCSTVMFPVLVVAFLPQQSAQFLSKLKNYLQTHNQIIGTGILFIFGAGFLFKGLSGLL